MTTNHIRANDDDAVNDKLVSSEVNADVLNVQNCFSS
jgi:hypothetical protein